MKGSRRVGPLPSEFGTPEGLPQHRPAAEGEEQETAPREQGVKHARCREVAELVKMHQPLDLCLINLQDMASKSVGDTCNSRDDQGDADDYCNYSMQLSPRRPPLWRCTGGD